MANLYEVVNMPNYDNLIVDTNPAADVYSVEIRMEAATAAELKRGTVLAFSSVDSKYVILGTTAADSETLTACAILAEDVTVGTTADAVAIAYRTGRFNRAKLIVKTGTTLSKAAEEDLHKAGILLDTALEA